MAIEVKINGKIVLNVVGMSIRSSISTISNSFSLLLSPGKNASQTQSNLNFKAGETAEVVIDGTPVINGFVDAVGVSFSADSHSIELTGRDRTADFIDSSVSELTLEGPLGFEDLLRTVLDGMGLNAIQIINLLPSGTDLTIRATKNIVSEIGQTGFDFIDQFARLKQVLLRGDGAGNIQMTRGGGDQRITTALVNVPGRPENNILSGSFLQSHADRFNKYTVRSQEDFSSEGFDLDVDEAVSNAGEGLDAEIRATRNLVFESEENSTSEEAAERAKWEANLRRARATKFVAVVPGYSVRQTDALGTSQILWQPNAKVPLVDVFSNIASQMLISDVNYRLSQSSGSTTEITLVPPDAYTIQASRDAAEARNSLIGKEDDE